ncbi:2-hydroxychromene-2-carboxylate isomerase [Zavarzinia compransoris]|uniref:2-hydroxychromene-2-carboxylate isomerase n=1 Tax=Zavarzinia compransoris TaxID=1264899 RepID=UPI0010DC4B84|nr:DsbA family protein [Zavarzinia compransoris]TDP44451.1 2-hydroxychromene-2-carboxylate isomerase [Zavarzinia compransoris]
MTTIDFVFGVSSRYSYLAASQLPALAAEFGVTFRWRPVTTIALVRQARGGGSTPFDGAPPAMQYDFKWRRQDAEAWASLYGIPFNEPHGRLKYDAVELNLGCVAAGLLGAVEPYARRLARRIFADDNDSPVGRADLIAAAAAAGLDGERFETQLAAPETQAAVAAIQDEAAARGAFGVPSFLVDGKVIWGNDRIPLLRHHLATRA